MKLKSILILCAILAVVGVVFFAVSRPKPTTTPSKTPYVWNFDMNHLQYVEISLPKVTLPDNKPNTLAWVKHEDRYFYFDVADGSKVDNNRWGGGIPLILSGPGAARVIAQNVPDSALPGYGFNSPNMKILLKLDDSFNYSILLGDAVPSGNAYYIKLAENRDIYTVDSSWYDVVARLVTEPPYPAANFALSEVTISPSDPRVNQDIKLTIEATNTGGVPGSRDINLRVNAIIEQTQTIALLPREKRVLTFTIRKDKPGTYSINIDGKTARLVIQ